MAPAVVPEAPAMAPAIVAAPAIIDPVSIYFLERKCKRKQVKLKIENMRHLGGK